MEDPETLAENLLTLQSLFPFEDISELVVHDIDFVRTKRLQHLPEVRVCSCEALPLALILHRASLVLNLQGHDREVADTHLVTPCQRSLLQSPVR